MSTPLLSSSPTVQLEVPSDTYQLRADAVRAPDPSNGLVINSNGLYAKKAQRRFPWSINTGGTLTPSGTGTTLATTLVANQVISWTTESYDPDGLVDLTAAATKVTFTTAGRYMTAVNFYSNEGAGSTNGVAQLLLIRNGSIVEAVQEMTSGTTSGAGAPVNLGAALQATVTAAAGDYLEVYFRWLPGSVGLVSSLYTAFWGGGAITT